MGADRFGRRPVLGGPYLIPALVALSVCVAGAGCGQSPPADCLAPTEEVVRSDAAKSLFVARVTVTGHPRLAQGPTSGVGLLLRTDETLSGQAPPAEFALWNEPGTPDLPDGTTVILFGRRGVTGDAPATADGRDVAVFHVAVPAGVLEQRDGELTRLCRDGRSDPAGDEVLREL